MSSFQGSSIQQYVRKDKVPAADAVRRDQASGPNVIIRKFTLQKGKFGSEEDKSVPAMAAASQVVVKEEGKKSFDTLPCSTVNQRCITVKKVEPPQCTVESVKMQEVSSAQGSKAVPVILSKATRLGLVGGKLVILQPMEEQQQPYVINVPNTTVYKKMKLTPPDESDTDEVQVLAVKPPLSSTRDIKKPSAVSTSPPKLVKTEAVLSKESPTKSCQFKLEASANNSKGCYLVPFGNVNHSNKPDVLRLSSSPQNEVKVIQTNNGNQLLIKKNIESEVGTSAEAVLNNSVPKKAMVLTSGLKTAQPILKLSDAPENLPPGAKTFMFPANNISGEKTNGTIKYVTLPGHMLPKLPPGTKVYTTSATAGTTLTAENIKVLATPKPVPESKTPANMIELKVEVDEKGDVVDVTPTRPLPKEKVDTEKGPMHGSWALLQKRCDRAMELKRKVLQKDRCQSRVRKIPARTVTEVDRGTQTSFFSLVEPGRLVEIQLEEERLSEGKSVSDEKVASEGTSGAGVDDVEAPERKKAKTTSKPVSVYDVLVQHNIQAMCEKATPVNNDTPQRCKLSKIRKSAAPLVHPSCIPPKLGTPDFNSLLDSPSTPGSTALNTPEMRRQLMEDFAHCVQRDNSGNIPLHVAVSFEKLPLVKRHCALLTARKAPLDVHNDDMETPLHMAVMLHSVEIIQVLLSFGAKVSVSNSLGNTALHLAVLEGSDHVLNTLLNYSKEDFPLDSFNDEGLAPLHLCAQADKVEEAKALLNEGAEIDLKDAKSGRTPLFHAVERNAVNLVKMLLELGANPNLPNFSGHTALLAANEFCDNPTPLTNDPLFMTPKLRPLNAEDGPVVAALVGLASDRDAQMFRRKEQILEQR